MSLSLAETMKYKTEQYFTNSAALVRALKNIEDAAAIGQFEVFLYPYPELQRDLLKLGFTVTKICARGSDYLKVSWK